MKCPFLMMAFPNEAGRCSPTEADCLEQDCAWWDKPMGRCYLATMAISLGWTALHLGKIAGSMPYKKQYQK